MNIFGDELDFPVFGSLLSNIQMPGSNSKAEIPAAISYYARNSCIYTRVRSRFLSVSFAVLDIFRFKFENLILHLNSSALKIRACIIHL